MSGCSSVQVSANCNSIDVVKSNSNSIEVSSRRPRGSVTMTKTVTNTAVVDKHYGGSGSGGVAQSYTFNQAIPALTWVVNHNLSYNPAVSIVSSSGDLVHGDVTYSGPQQITINFSAPFSGRVYLS